MFISVDVIRNRVQARWNELREIPGNTLGYGEFDVEMGHITATATVHGGKIQYIEINDRAEKVRRKIKVDMI